MRKFNVLLIALFCLSIVTASAQEVQHTVASGNTLSGLAKQYYKDMKNWKPIFDANKGKKLKIATNPSTKKPYVVPTMLVNPNLIYPGQILTIPNTTGGEKPVEPMTAAELSAKAEGTWKVMKAGGPLPTKDAFVKMEKGGKLYAYNAALDAKEDWTEIGKWEVKEDKSFVLTIAGKETSYVIDEADVKANKWGFMMMDEKGTTVADVEMMKATPPPKTFDVTGKVMSGGKALAGVSVSGGGKSATTDASGAYTLRGVKEGDEVKFSKNTYNSASGKITGGKIADVTMIRQEPPVKERTFTGSIMRKNGSKGAKKAEVTLKIGGKSYGPYIAEKDGSWKSDPVPYEWEQTGTYEVVYKKDKKTGNIPDTATGTVKVGTVNY